ARGAVADHIPASGGASCDHPPPKSPPLRGTHGTPPPRDRAQVRHRRKPTGPGGRKIQAMSPRGGASRACDRPVWTRGRDTGGMWITQERESWKGGASFKGPENS